MNRFYSDSGNISGDKIIISDKSQVHHIKDVLRLEAEEEVVVFDDKGREYISVIEKLLPKEVVIRIMKEKKIALAPKVRVTVACAIPKKSKMDDIIDKLTQLGVDRIIPLLTERVIVKLDKRKEILRKERWEKIALSSAKQSQRNIMPVVEPVRGIKEVLSASEEYDLKLIPTLFGERKSLREVLNKSSARNILFLIGPEGDFSEEEVELAKKAGFLAISLGDSVLRVETAALCVASFIRIHENG